MSDTPLKDYELMVIFTPILNDEGYKKAISTMEASITDAGGKIVHSNPWGLKQLAYPIEKKTTGLYWVLEFQSSADYIENLKVNLGRNEDVMRSMITVLDKHAVAYNEKKRNQPAKKEEPAPTEEAES